MGKPVDKVQAEIVLENAKAVREYLDNLPPAEKLKDMVEDHILRGDTILAVISDVAEMGWRESDGNDRFHAISVLLQQYRNHNSRFIRRMYAFTKKAAA